MSRQQSSAFSIGSLVLTPKQDDVIKMSSYKNIEVHMDIHNSNDEKKCLKPDDLRQAFMPTLRTLCGLLESGPFQKPMEPQALPPNYPTIVKKPMDLSTIENKLLTDQYTDPWEYVDDVWLMFDNAWLYYKKTSQIYKYCTKLSEVFNEEINSVMQTLGYCCGRKYTFNPEVLRCYGKQLCTIPSSAEYYSYQNQNRYTFCQKCFSDIPGDTVTLGDDPMQPNIKTAVKKQQFRKIKNEHLEPFVTCTDCNRRVHQICVLHITSGFTCDTCLKKKEQKRKENKFNAKGLPVTELGTYIETRVKDLMKNEAGAGEVAIRVLDSRNKIFKVKPNMYSRFVRNGDMSSEFPYRSKAIFAFQKVDGNDVCFFGMHVQEYGNECTPPNTRHVYIAYLDSVKFFQPSHIRTAVYHEILLGYFKHIKQLGFVMAHIWACPPSERNNEYIFHCRPANQKIQNFKRLQNWYIEVLNKGKKEGIVIEYKNIKEQSEEDSWLSAAKLPYFDGDFWPEKLENIIEKLNREEEKKRKKAETAEAAANTAISSLSEDAETSDGKKKGQKMTKKSKANQTKNSKKSLKTGNNLWTKISAIIDKHKKEHFVIRLHSAERAASLAPIEDPDPVIKCDLMDGRDPFLTMARERDCEFSSLRRAKFSTLSLLYELHKVGNQSNAVMQQPHSNLARQQTPQQLMQQQTHQQQPGQHGGVGGPLGSNQPQQQRDLEMRIVRVENLLEILLRIVFGHITQQQPFTPPPVPSPQGVMGPPGISVQQQLMESVRSPPPIRSPQPDHPSPRPVPSLPN
ncbi:CREB-binding protein-like [Temnothorax nylanderi]|uniref:CREB-binding protein-like n=1 Tax=Temnothorax nylanderi TaxID=102681 RepID=UPI003A865E44